MIFLEENFEYANTLKAALENLRAAGEIIGLYEQEKKQAILLEDYDKAKYKKIQIDNFRRKVYNDVHIEEILNLQNVSTITSIDPPNFFSCKLVETFKLFSKIRCHFIFFFFAFNAIPPIDFIRQI